MVNADFSLWLAEFDEPRPRGSLTDEEAHGAIARFLFTNGWTLEAPEACGICGLPCRYRDRDGTTVHPICPDAPPGLTWEELVGGTGRLDEALLALRLGYQLGAHDPCTHCGRPTRYQDATGAHHHPLCAQMKEPKP